MSETYFVKQHKKEKFTILDNTCIRDSRLSWKAKGLHTYFMSLPEDWKIYLTDLVTRASDGRDSVNTAIKELEGFGYLQRNIERSENGRFKQFCYVVFESPLTENPLTDNPRMEKPITGNPQLLTTDIINTNLNKTKLTNYDEQSTEKVRESVFVKKIKELFAGEYPFDSDFESAVISNFSRLELSEINLESYLEYVFERTKLGNVKKSFEGLFRTLGLSNSIIRDFKNSTFYERKEETKRQVKEKSKQITCPICNIEFYEYQYYCPKCNLTAKSIETNDVTEINIAQVLVNMSEEEKKAFELAKNEKLKSLGRLFFIRNEKEEFYREYGLIN